MGNRILILQGHPDTSERHLCHALADAYENGAKNAGRDVRVIEIAKVDLPPLRSAREWRADAPPAAKAAQDDILWADHIMLIYPLWIGTTPALVKAFLEQVFREGFALPKGSNAIFNKQLKGRSARIVVTMGMPAFVYRWYFGAHSLKNLERNLLRFVGFKPVNHTVLGLVEMTSNTARNRWLRKLEKLGAQGA